VRRLLEVGGRYFKPLALVATVAGLAIALWSQWDAISSFDWQLAWLPFAASVGLFAVAPVIQGTAFWLVLRALRVPSRLDDALVIWTRSFLVRYAPSGALALVLRIRERERLGASQADIYVSFAYEQLIALASGAVACLVGFAVVGSWPPLAATAVSAAVLVLAVAVRPGFLGRHAQRVLQGRGYEVTRLLRGRQLAYVIAFNALGWVAMGAATWLLVDSLADTPTPEVAWLVAAYAFSYLLGFVVPVLPGGLGVRDATLIGFLATRFTTGVATALAVAVRLANTLGELVAIAAVEAAYRARQRRVGTARESPSG
jgi:glycosyltransferase 2 family protein